VPYSIAHVWQLLTRAFITVLSRLTPSTNLENHRSQESRPSIETDCPSDVLLFIKRMPCILMSGKALGCWRMWLRASFIVLSCQPFRLLEAGRYPTCLQDRASPRSRQHRTPTFSQTRHPVTIHAASVTFYHQECTPR
jgi:hypothetical protein